MVRLYGCDPPSPIPIEHVRNIYGLSMMAYMLDKYVNMQHNYVNMRDNYVTMLHVNIINMLHEDKKKSHVA